MRILVVAAAVSLLLVASAAEAHHRPGHGGGPPAPQEPREPLHVYDFFEQRLGQYTSLGCFIRQIEGHWVEICGLESQGNQELGLYFLLFSTPDCDEGGGQAYLTTWSGENEWQSAFTGPATFRGDPLNRLSRRGFINAEGSWIVFAADPITWVPVRSWLDPDGGDCFNLDPGYETFAGPAFFFDMSNWVPPFSIR